MSVAARRGFTLLEALLVIALLSVLAAVVWPDFAAARRSEQLGESAGRIKALLAMSRAQAMNEARTYRVRIRTDGTLNVRVQRDALLAPHTYIKVRDTWATLEFLLPDVWVAALQPLPEGPPPILIEDDEIEFPDELEEDPDPISDFDAPFDIFFAPDGTSGSARWVLRDADGRGLMMTLDGRLGRVTIEPVDPLEKGEIERPEKLDQPDEDEVDEESLPDLEDLRIGNR